MPKNSSKYVGDCTVKGVANKFRQLGYMTDIPHTVSTGNKVADKYIAKYASKALGAVAKAPTAKVIIKGSKFAYPYVEKGGANIARGIATYNETCKKIK